MENIHRSNVWILKSKGEESAFGGNEGYADQIDSHYVYDTTVKNHDKIAKGDLVIITGKKYIEGFALIENIGVEKNISKIRYRCPVCNSQEHYERKNLTPRYKCRNKHAFDSPTEENILVDQFTAIYESSFIPAPSKTSAKLLDDHYVRRNFYYSIQLAKFDFFQRTFPDVIKKLLESKSDFGSSPQSLLKDALPDKEYRPLLIDNRISKTVQFLTRQGQQLFREKLFRIYGTKCMMSGCEVPEAIEASHINPYRGENDNHPANGLLLRRDLHAIFDANLLGINPETMRISVHQSLINSEYKEFEGQKVNIERSDFSPSKEALRIRWKLFKEIELTIH